MSTGTADDDNDGSGVASAERSGGQAHRTRAPNGQPTRGGRGAHNDACRRLIASPSSARNRRSVGSTTVGRAAVAPTAESLSVTRCMLHVAALDARLPADTAAGGSPRSVRRPGPGARTTVNSHSLWHAVARRSIPSRGSGPEITSDQRFIESERRESNPRSQLGKLMFCL